ncbi:hypothetical protein CRG98_035617 [Punica granatum]|uniref:Uncharacterized protein n=1 Tax=Punica granatum TaxID=22663 RepID=A0A2I0IIU0_PUNGR|nr:hypothetical protein CRG98_035617 [Punica granatum]
MDQKHSNVGVDQEKGDYTPLKDEEDPKLGLYDKPLPCFVMWYFATILYFCNYYQKDPRERAGLAASAIAAMICTVAIIIAAAVIMSG